MSPSPPTPPNDLPTALVDALEACSPAQLSNVADYTEALAAYREREAAAADENLDGEGTDDRPDDVPAKASLTIKTINDNRYSYWQWREGDKIKSKYRGPASGDE
jgi:hypothetical protein